MMESFKLNGRRKERSRSHDATVCFPFPTISVLFVRLTSLHICESKLRRPNLVAGGG
jgi:hypothetical protein